MGDFTPDRLDSRSLHTPWELKNRVLLEEYYIFNLVIPPEDEYRKKTHMHLGRVARGKIILTRPYYPK